jgi:hypothetical protein
MIRLLDFSQNCWISVTIASRRIGELDFGVANVVGSINGYG